MHSFLEGIGIRNEVCLCGICLHMGNDHAQQWESHAVHRHKALAWAAGLLSWKLSCPSADEKSLAIRVETVEVLESGRGGKERLLNS